MDAWHRHWLGRAQAAANRQELTATATEAARALGFERFCYLQSTWLLHSRTVVLTLHDHLLSRPPHDLRRADADPAIVHCRFSNLPFVWQASAHGAGWAQGVSSPHALGVRGILSLTRDGPPPDDGDLQHMEPLLSLVSKAIHDAMLRIERPTRSATLTEREREVLRWTAVGKTSTEVAQILTISENTIKFHIKNATHKLGTANKTAAVVKAVLMGLLH
jgi:LuxR family transcriptional regulator